MAFEHGILTMVENHTAVEVTLEVDMLEERVVDKLEVMEVDTMEAQAVDKLEVQEVDTIEELGLVDNLHHTVSACRTTASHSSPSFHHRC